MAFLRLQRRANGDGKEKKDDRDEEKKKPKKEKKAQSISALAVQDRRRVKLVFLLGLAVGIAAIVLFWVLGILQVLRQTSVKYCLVFEDNFDGEQIDKSIWTHEQQTGGWGTGEFEWTTDSPNNSYVQDGKLYIVPTLTSDFTGEAAIVDGYSLNLTAQSICTSKNTSDFYCAVYSNETAGTILPPVQSARLTTKLSMKAIRFGKVEVTFRNPTGDWIWPAIWMMPVNNNYGDWPASGEIDIMESKGNPSTKRNDGLSARISSTMHWGPIPALDMYHKSTGHMDLLRGFWNEEFKTIGLQWTRDRIATWYKTPAKNVFEFSFPSHSDMWSYGNIPYTLANGSSVADPWTLSNNATVLSAAPFDQDFYLILSVAVGSTNGYFGPHDAPYGKPWSDQSKDASKNFWLSKDQWYPTWPTDKAQRALVIDSVKMWQVC